MPIVIVVRCTANTYGTHGHLHNYYQFRSQSKNSIQQIISDIYWANFELIPCFLEGTSCNCSTFNRLIRPFCSLALISHFIVATILMVVGCYKYKYAKLATIKTQFDKFHYKIHKYVCMCACVSKYICRSACAYVAWYIC